MTEYENPFCLGELDKLGRAREENDVEYLKIWCHKAVRWHAKEKLNLMKNMEPASKWKRLIECLSQILDKSDLADLEF